MNKLLIALCLCWVSCKKPPTTVPTTDLRDKPDNVLILNEGLFQWGQAELTLYNKSNQQTTQSVYQLYNNKKLGDVLQSASEWNGRLYLVLNNSGKIEVIDKKSLNYIHSISGLKSPRNIVFYQNKKAFITDLYSNAIAVYDLQTSRITNYINIKGWTEAALIVGNKLCVSAPKNKYMYILDADKEALTDSIETLYGGQSFELDATGKLWEACMGDSTKGFKAGLLQIDLSNRKVTHQIDLLKKNSTASHICANKDRTELFFLDKDVYSINIHSLHFTQYFDGRGKQLYGLNFDASREELYIADAGDFISAGTIYRHSIITKSCVDTFTAGIIPNGFIFY